MDIRSAQHLRGSPGIAVTFHLVNWTQSEADSFVAQASPIGTRPSMQHSCGFSAHLHEYPEIVLVLSGEIEHLVRVAHRILSAGMLLFIRPQDEHQFIPRNQPCELINLAFRADYLPKLDKFLGEPVSESFLGASSTPAFQLSPADAAQTASEMLALHSASLSGSRYAEARVRAFLANHFARHLLPLADRSPEMPAWLVRLCQQFDTMERLRSGLGEMKGLAPCTQEHLCKTFRRHLGKTPTQFINEQRVHYATSRLAQTNDTIHAIATDLGFKSQAQFYNVFRSVHGVTPNAYRRLSR